MKLEGVLEMYESKINQKMFKALSLLSSWSEVNIFWWNDLIQNCFIVILLIEIRFMLDSISNQNYLIKLKIRLNEND